MSSLTGTEFTAVEAASSVLHRRGHHGVEHLVEQYAGDEESGHPRLVEGRVNTDQALGGNVSAEANGAASPSPLVRPPTPRDEDVDLIAEPLTVQLVEELAQIVMLAPGPNIDARAWTLADPVIVGSDERIEEMGRATVAPRQKAGEGCDDRLVGVEKHVVQPHRQAPVDGARGDHGVRVVRDNESHRLMEPGSEASAQITRGVVWRFLDGDRARAGSGSVEGEAELRA